MTDHAVNDVGPTVIYVPEDHRVEYAVSSLLSIVSSPANDRKL